MRQIDKIIIHCSDSDIEAHDNLDTIRKWHVDERNFSDVGYHFFIRKSGLIEKGRDLDLVGAHCVGQNKTSIGICCSGKHHFTHSQFLALKGLIDSLYIILQKALTIHGHCEFSTKTCPNFSVEEFVENYLS